MANRFTIEAIFKAVDRISAPVSRMQNQIGKMTRRVGSGLDKLNRRMDKFAGGAKRFAAGVTVALFATGAAMANVIATGAQFEQTLVSAAVKFPGEIRKGTKAFEELKQAALATGAATEFTATQSAEALNFLAMAGFNAESAIASLPGLIDFATASALDVGRASDIASDSMSAFGLLSKDAAENQKNLARVSDVLVLSSFRANTSIQDMFEAIKDGAPVARKAGQSIETTAALIAAMAQSGIKGSRAGTSLKNSMLAIGAPSAKQIGVLKKLKISTEDMTGGIRDAVDVFEEFRDKLKGRTETEALTLIKDFFGVRSIAGAAGILDTIDNLRALREEIVGARDVSKEAADVMRDTIQGRLNALKSAVESVKLEIFDLNTGPLADVIDRMTEWVRANKEFIANDIGEFLGKIIDNIDRIAAVTIGVTATTAAFVALMVVLKLFTLVMATVNIVMAANPVVLITLAVIAGIAAVVLFLLNWRKVAEVFSGLPIILQTFLGALFPILLLTQLAKGVLDAWEPVKEFFEGLFSGDLLSGGLDKISGFIGGILETIGFDLSEDEKSRVSPEVVSPQERTARTINESRTTSAAEITIRPGEGSSAEVTKGALSRGVSLIPSGAF